jgi:tRNA-intron endonuclease
METTERTLEGTLLENRVAVDGNWAELAEKFYGKETEHSLDLSFVEALYLLEKGKIAVKKGRSSYDFPRLMKFGLGRDRRLYEKYIVYKDIRDRGLVVKTGLKFGCDFRVYARGVGVKKGPKQASEHTKWIVYALPEDATCSFAELARAVRLAHSIRARMLWAIVDNEGEVTYHEVVRLKL